MRPIPVVSVNQHGVFTTQQAIDAGWTESALAWSVDKDRLARVVPGAYVDARALDGDRIDDRRRGLIVRSVAASLTIPASVVSHASAATMGALPLLQLPSRPCVTVPPRHTGDAQWAHLHRASLEVPSHVLRGVGQVPRTSSARTVVDIAREHGVDEAVVVGDAALHRGRTTVHALEEILSQCANWPGIRRGREAVARLDGSAESPLESISRLRILESSLPRPSLQTDIVDSNGRWLGRTDFLWDMAGVVGEADGMEKYDKIAGMPLRREKLRQELLERSGLVVVRWDWMDLADPPRLIARIARALARGSSRPAVDREWFARAG